MAGPVDVARVTAACGTGRASVAKQLSTPLAGDVKAAGLPTGAVVAASTGFPGAGEAASAPPAGEPLSVEQLSGGQIQLGGSGGSGGGSSAGGRTGSIQAESAGRSGYATGCSNAEIERAIAAIAAEGKRRAGGSGAGTAVLAAEYTSSESLMVYRKCYRPEFDPIIRDLESVYRWSQEQKVNLGLI